MAPSDKRISFIRRLLDERSPDEHLALEARQVIEGTRDRRQASGIIERLLNAAKTDGSGRTRADVEAEGTADAKHRAERDANVRVTEPGVYRQNGEVYIVKPNRQKTKLYAKRLVETGGTRVTETGDHVQIEFEYAAGAIYRLSPEDRMPFEDAKALTARYGRCIVCGRHLKAAQSVERGIGPVCATYFTDAAGTEDVADGITDHEAAERATAPRPVAIDAQTGEEHECLDGPQGCSGAVEFRMPLSGTGRSFARCERHWAERVAKQEGIASRYPVSAPSDFDPAYAGERWDED